MKKRTMLLMTALLLSSCISVIAQDGRAWGQWDKWGEQPDSTYLNPVIPSDYSDLDCICVGDDYYAISSTMQFAPGMTLLHSTDLVNWEICTNIVADLTQIGPDLNWDRMNRSARGVWAGTLRHHNDRFYLFFGTPDEGYFMTSAPKAEGPWQPLTCLLDEAGWDDCTVAWDEKGNACFVGTHFADGYKTYLFDMAPDGTSIDKSSARLINSGDHREANKLIKVGKWWYLVFSEHKDGIGRYVLAKRSRRMKGPYKEERQLALTSWEAHEPNQGGIVTGKDGKWYFLTHHGSGDWSGRIVSLLPVTWIDEWPIIGEVIDDERMGKIGRMQWQASMPSLGGEKLSIQRSDDFDAATLGAQWQWNYQPRADKYSLTERPGWMRLKAFRPIEPNRLLKAGNTLTQRTFQSRSSVVTVKIDISSMADGQRAGLCHFSAASSAVGVVQEGGQRYMEWRHNDEVKRADPVGQNSVWLQSRWGLDGMSTYYYSLDGDTFIPFGAPYRLQWGNYRGDRIGIYSFNDLSDEGYIDVDYLHYRLEK